MHGDRGVLVGIRRLDLRGQRKFVLQRLPDREQLPGKGGDGRFRNAPARHDVMREADRLDLLLGPARRAAKCSGRDFGGLVGRMVLRNGLGRIDRKEFRRAAVARRGRDRVRGDLAVDRAGREIGIRLLVADGLGGLVGRKLDDLDLCRIDAVLLQDHLEQIDIGLGAADDADPAPGELRDFRDGGRGLLSLGLAGRRHPQHRDVLAQRRHGLRIFRHFEVAPDDGEIGLAFTEQGGACSRAIGLHRAQPDQAAFWLLKACVRFWTTLRSSLLAGPTAIRSVTGRIAK